MYLDEFYWVFFDKKILISQRYQLHLASTPVKWPKDIKDAHGKKTKKGEKGPNTMVNSSHKTHTKHTKSSQKQHVQKENNAQTSSSSDPRF
jgi:hypothetical protein